MTDPKPSETNHMTDDATRKIREIIEKYYGDPEFAETLRSHFRPSPFTEWLRGLPPDPKVEPIVVKLDLPNPEENPPPRP